MLVGGLKRSNDAIAFIGHQANALVLNSVVFNQFITLIGGMIIYNEQLPVGITLDKDAVQACGQVGVGILERCDDTYLR